MTDPDSYALAVKTVARGSSSWTTRCTMPDMGQTGPATPAEGDEDSAGVVKLMAIDILARLTPDLERTRAELRRVLAQHYRNAGNRVPNWLRGPVARPFLDDGTGRE